MRRIFVGDFRIGRQERSIINSVLDSGRISEHQKTRDFERDWAKYIGTKYCIATSSGAGALISSLTALKYIFNFKKRPKVITSALTYIADASALSVTGFEPVFVDIDPHTFCISVEAIENHLKSCRDINEYSIILPVDLMGYSVELDRIKMVAKKYKLLVLEDASEAHGTVYKGKVAGSDADLGVFSFYLAHNIQAGEMGAVTTHNKEIYHFVKRIKAQGRSCECRICTRDQGTCPVIKKRNGSNHEDVDPRFMHDIIGYNFKTMEFQAALALVQIKRISSIINKRQKNVKYLNEGLQEFSGLFQLPLYSPNLSYLAYPLVIKKPSLISRKLLRSELEKNGIETRPLFGCIPLHQPAYSHLKRYYKNRLPNAEFAGLNGFYIGCHQYLNKEDMDYIIGVFKKTLRKICT